MGMGTIKKLLLVSLLWMPLSSLAEADCNDRANEIRLSKNPEDR